MKKVFKTHINFGSYIWGIVVIIFIGVLLFEALGKERYIGTLLLYGICVSIWYFTFFFKRYWIEGHNLFIKTISSVRSIDIRSIHKLETNKVDWFGSMGFTVLKPYRRGMVLRYNVVDHVFVDPKNAIEFINELKQITPNIDVVQGK